MTRKESFADCLRGGNSCEKYYKRCPRMRETESEEGENVPFKGAEYSYMTEKERLANCMCGDNVYTLPGVKDIEYPPELNAFIVVMGNGRKYIVAVNDYEENND